MNPFAFLNVPGPLVAVLLVLSLCSGSYWAGDRNRNNAWLAKEALVAQQAAAALQAEVARGEKAQLSFTAEYLAMESGFTKLEGKFNDFRKSGPLVVFRNRPVGAGAAGAVDVIEESAEPPPGGARTGPAERPATPAAPSLGADAPGQGGGRDAGPGGHVGGGLGLSVGAVWLWNSALVNRDAPVGACGAADPTAAACAADAGIGLEAAWDNHAANARTCAQDRLRHQRLIDYITARNQPAKAP